MGDKTIDFSTTFKGGRVLDKEHIPALIGSGWVPIVSCKCKSVKWRKRNEQTKRFNV